MKNDEGYLYVVREGETNRVFLRFVALGAAVSCVGLLSSSQRHLWWSKEADPDFSEGTGSSLLIS